MQLDNLRVLILMIKVYDLNTGDVSDSTPEVLIEDRDDNLLQELINWYFPDSLSHLINNLNILQRGEFFCAETIKCFRKDTKSLEISTFDYNYSSIDVIVVDLSELIELLQRIEDGLRKLDAQHS